MTDEYDEAWKLELLASRPLMARRELADGEEADDASALLELIAKHGGKCWYCGCALTPPAGDASIGTTGTREHLLPRSRGGGNKASNVVAACRKCNVSKQSKTVEEYRAHLSRGMSNAVVFYGEGLGEE